MRMRPDQLQAAQRHSMAAHDLDALIPSLSDAAAAAGTLNQMPANCQSAAKSGWR